MADSGYKSINRLALSSDDKRLLRKLLRWSPFFEADTGWPDSSPASSLTNTTEAHRIIQRCPNGFSRDHKEALAKFFSFNDPDHIDRSSLPLNLKEAIRKIVEYTPPLEPVISVEYTLTVGSGTGMLGYSSAAKAGSISPALEWPATGAQTSMLIWADDTQEDYLLVLFNLLDGEFLQLPAPPTATLTINSVPYTLESDVTASQIAYALVDQAAADAVAAYWTPLVGLEDTVTLLIE